MKSILESIKKIANKFFIYETTSTEQQKEQPIFQLRRIKPKNTIIYNDSDLLEISEDEFKDISEKIRSSIRCFNYDGMFSALCNKVNQCMVVKGYFSLTLDKKKIQVQITYSDWFNKYISDYVKDYIVPKVEEDLSRYYGEGKYSTISTNGDIFIRKIKE